MERSGWVVSLVIASLPEPPDAIIYDDGFFGGGQISGGNEEGIWPSKEGGHGSGGGPAEGVQAPSEGDYGCGAADDAPQAGGEAGQSSGDAGGEAGLSGGDTEAEAGLSGGDTKAEAGQSGGDTEAGDPEADAGQEPVGWGAYRHDCYDQYMDLYLDGRPRSSFWLPIWEAKPLCFHDKELVLAHDYLKRCRGGRLMNLDGLPSVPRAVVDLTREITAVLSLHPGPVRHFRIDSSYWHDPEADLEAWLNILSEKKVEELVLINLMHPADTIFPIEELQSPYLKYLCLGFLDIPHFGLLSFDCSSLTTLELACCSFDGRRLCWVITDCPCLRSLSIGFCTQNLKIISSSLVTMRLWQSSASWFAVKSCPKLMHLTIGVKPKRGATYVSVAIDGAPVLRELEYFHVPCHNVTVNSISISKELASFSSLEELRVGINFAIDSERLSLLNILCCFPGIKHLILWRLDEVGACEGMGSTLDSNAPDVLQTVSVMPQLQYLIIGEFRGGPAELEILRIILRSASQLSKVRVKCCLSSPEQEILEAIKEVKELCKASVQCQLIVHGLNTA